MTTIALDAMGGDFAPGVTVDGAKLALDENPGLKIILTGRAGVLKPLVGKTERLSIADASEIIGMDEAGAKAIKSKTDSSLVKALELVGDGKAGGALSAGNSGAVMAGAIIKLGRIKGVSRPSFSVIMPTPEKPILLLDAGANPDCKAEHLFQFAEMGSAFYQSVFHKKSPSIGLLNIGEEKSKGDSVIQTAHRLIEESSLNFYGNVEGRDISAGTTDIVVCDGFTGNVVLKTMEGLASILFSELKNVINSATINKVGGFLLSKSLKRLHSRLNHDTYGGAHLLGVNGVCVISHGSANKTAIKNALKMAKEAVDGQMIGKMTEVIDGGSKLK